MPKPRRYVNYAWVRQDIAAITGFEVVDSSEQPELMAPPGSYVVQMISTRQRPHTLVYLVLDKQLLRELWQTLNAVLEERKVTAPNAKAIGLL